MAVGYFWSILAMVSAPFLLLGLVGSVIARQLRRERESR